MSDTMPTPDEFVPERCVIVIDDALGAGHAANAAAVIALTLGQQFPKLVGEPLVDASGTKHPGLIPIGIPVLSAEGCALAKLRRTALEQGCKIVSFPIQGQQTTNYEAFRAAVAEIEEDDLQYVGIALVGAKKPVRKLVAKLKLLS